MISHRLLLLLPLASAAALIPVGVAAARGDGHAPTSQSSLSPPVAPLGVGSPTAAGFGSVMEPPRPGSGIDTSRLVPGLTATYGAATGGLFASPPSNPASGYVAEGGQNQPPAVGEIDSYLASDGHTYYRVVNRAQTGVTFSH